MADSYKGWKITIERVQVGESNHPGSDGDYARWVRRSFGKRELLGALTVEDIMEVLRELKDLGD